MIKKNNCKGKTNQKTGRLGYDRLFVYMEFCYYSVTGSDAIIFASSC